MSETTSDPVSSWRRHYLAAGRLLKKPPSLCASSGVPEPFAIVGTGTSGLTNSYRVQLSPTFSVFHTEPCTSCLTTLLKMQLNSHYKTSNYTPTTVQSYL